MTGSRYGSVLGLLLCGVAASAGPVAGQTRAGGAGAAPVIVAPGVAAAVRDAPYSADAITTVTQTLSDGTKIERSVTAKVFRDGAGRTRREQTVLGLASLAPAADAVRVITIADPVARVSYTLDERTRTARQSPLAPVRLFVRQNGPVQAQPFFRVGRPGLSGPDGDAAALTRPGDLLDQLAARRGTFDDRDRQLADLAAQLVQQAPRGGNPGTTATLGTRQMEGLTVTGRRTTQTIAAGEVGNDRPIGIVDETWESPDLQVVISSRHVDPRTGTVDYRLANVRRGEPPADLFVVPTGYTVVGTAASAAYLAVLPPAAPAPPASPALPPNPPAPAPPALTPFAPGARSGSARGAVAAPASPARLAPLPTTAIFVTGAVARPGGYAFQSGITVEQVLERAGTPMPRDSRVVLMRNGRQISDNADPKTPLQAGDVVVLVSKQ